jgi:hypothetical protein
MLGRCYDAKHSGYPHYGGRGIAVCDAWRQSFPAFLQWAHAAGGYRFDKSVDRIDGDGHYYPENCRWATAKQQATNRRKAVPTNHHVVTHDGKSLNLSEWSRFLGIPYTTLCRRFHAGRRGKDLLRLSAVARYRKALAVTQTKNGKAKLLTEEVEAIRVSVLSTSLLARQYRVSPSSISMIRHGHRRSAA